MSVFTLYLKFRQINSVVFCMYWENIQCLGENMYVYINNIKTNIIYILVNHTSIIILFCG